MSLNRRQHRPWPRAQFWVGMLCMLTIVGIHRPSLAEEPPANGILRVITQPEGATVYLGVLPIGETPLSHYTPVGKHTVRVLRDGSEPYVRRVTIREGQTTNMTATLANGDGSVEIVVDPAGTKLKIESGEEWPTPVRLKDLEPGTYSYTLSAAGHEDQSGSFTFIEGRNFLLTATLMSSAGKVSIKSNPSGALVILDGEDVGLTPLHLEDVPAGEHTAQLVYRGRAAVFRRFDTSDGSKGEIEVRMSKQGIPLSISTRNKRSELEIEGMELGPQASYRFGPVERGRYQITLTAPGKKSIEQSLLVPAQGTALYRARLRPKDGARPSTLQKNPPFYKHWLFWGTISATTAGLTTMAVLNFKAAAPSAVPAGDLLVTMP